MKTVIFSIIFLFCFFSTGQQGKPDCSQIEARVFTKTVILLEREKEFNQAADDYEKAVKEYQDCQLSLNCSQTEARVFTKTVILLEREKEFNQATDDYEKAVKEYQDCKISQ